MSDEPTIDIMEDEKQSNPIKSSSKCGYCDCEKEGLPIFYCESCGKWVHSSCLLSGSPSPILFDNFFHFKCFRCTDDGTESFTRIKMTWNQVTSLALFNIAQSSPGKDGFHKWKEVVVEFVEKHWQLLFGSFKKKSNPWVNTIAATLSSGNPHQFTSGYGFFKESGWWKLTDPSIPPEYNPFTPAAKARETKLRRSKAAKTPLSASKVDGLRKRTCTTPLATQLNEQRISSQAKSQKVEISDRGLDDSPPSFKGCTSPIASPGSSPTSQIDSMVSKVHMPMMDSPLLGLRPLNDDSDGDGNGGDVRSAFSPVRRRSIKVKAAPEEIDKKPELKEMSLYEECNLLKKLESYGSHLKTVPMAYQLRRKLLVRQRKRELNIPIIGFDKLVRSLLAQETTDMKSHIQKSIFPQMPSTGQLRILDRFQTGFSVHSQQNTTHLSFRQKLIGFDDNDVPPSIISPYTQRVLQPYIRRDYESRPLKLRLLQEIQNRGESSPEKSKLSISPIDYCYVHHQHIPSINSICHHFFWPGIDMTESLQYPDFSVVALYRKMVVGFGFMVPDVSFNEAYITFLFVHPEWRCAGIGTFMLYHLIQTCMGKDVTLHVSASNPAMLVYQKFGFKPESFIVDFYEKYYGPDSTECKHAFFMRLRR